MNFVQRHVLVTIISVFALAALGGCGSTQATEDRKFHTSGDRDADQRAEQRVAQDSQLKGKSGQSNAETGNEKTLYDRLGGDQGLQAIVSDFVDRAIADPRVNFKRMGITRGGLSIHRGATVEWKPTDEDIKMLKEHMVEFLGLATGGPAKYQGKEMKQAHAGMHITNAEFDASIGDFKASLDKVGVKTAEQKELLAIIETVRPQVVEER